MPPDYSIDQQPSGVNGGWVSIWDETNYASARALRLVKAPEIHRGSVPETTTSNNDVSSANVQRRRVQRAN